MIRSPYLALALAPLIWSTNFVIGKTLTETIPPFTLAAIRWTIGLIVLIPLVAWPRPPVVERRHWPALIALGVLGVYLYNALVYVALRSTLALNATLIQAAIPAVTAVLATTLLRERRGIWRWAGVAAAFVGVAWIAAAGRPEALATLELNRGDLVMFANVFIWALYTIVAQRLLRHVGPLVATFYAVLIGLVPLVPTAIWEMQGWAWPTPTPGLVLTVLYLGVFPTIVAYVLWNRGVAAIGAARAALFVNLLPLYTAVLGAIVLGERVAPHHAVGGLLVAGGVFLGTRPTRS